MKKKRNMWWGRMRMRIKRQKSRRGGIGGRRRGVDACARSQHAPVHDVQG